MITIKKYRTEPGSVLKYPSDIKVDEYLITHIKCKVPYAKYYYCRWHTFEVVALMLVKFNKK